MKIVVIKSSLDTVFSIIYFTLSIKTRPENGRNIGRSKAGKNTFPCSIIPSSKMMDQPRKSNLYSETEKYVLEKYPIVLS